MGFTSGLGFCFSFLPDDDTQWALGVLLETTQSRVNIDSYSGTVFLTLMTRQVLIVIGHKIQQLSQVWINGHAGLRF